MITQAPTLGRVLGAWSFEALPAAFLLMPAVLYAVGIRRARSPWPWNRTICFYAGLFLIALAIFSGIDPYSDALLSMHMVQHVLLLDVAPPLLAWGAPIRLAFASLPRRGRRRLARVLHRRALRVLMTPAVGVAAYVVVLLGTHFTGLFELALRDRMVHDAEHAAYVLAGLLFFAPLIGADPLPSRPGALERVGAFTVAMGSMVLPGAWLIFSHTVRYPFYIVPAHALGVSALADQQAAGVVMIFGAGLTMLALKLILFVQALLAEEHRQRRRERHLDVTIDIGAAAAAADVVRAPYASHAPGVAP